MDRGLDFFGYQGYALFSQHKLEPAIEVLREQTRINPFDDYAYNLLGRALWMEQKYEDAESAFRKQLEISPLDKWTHGNLGIMLVEWRKYKEAVPELEQAITLNPDAEWEYQISLGRAYLNLGQPEKAGLSFDKAVKLQPGQRTWNDVAYFLAVAKVQLEKAQQYAESAVTEVATSLRNVDLAQLTPNDLENVAALASDWDTLGWVHFQKGEIDEAEKYIGAAWALGQHGEVGYHMGRTLEARGKTEEAMHAYALAVVEDRSVPEARQSLDRLAGKNKSELFLKQASDEVRESRTIKLGPVFKGAKTTGDAQFFVVLVPSTSGAAQVAETKFISGDEKLRDLASALKGASFKLVFPSSSATKVIRRGTLFCQANGECSFIMISPEYVSSVD